MVVGYSHPLQYQTAHGAVEKLGVSHDVKGAQEMRVDDIPTVFFAVLVKQSVNIFQNV